jgi:CubicO group peptidase (beta-lactamase class C family)
MKPAEVTLDNWQEGPANRWAFQHVAALVPTQAISRGTGQVLELVPATSSWERELDEPLARLFTDGIIVLRGREIVFERYLNGMTPATRHLLQSVSKSISASIVGQYVASGAVDVDSVVAAYVPELAESAYGDATVQQVLDMTAGVAYDEEYTNPNAEVQVHERVGGWRPSLPGDPADTYAFLAGLRKSGEHGGNFAYCSANTDVLAWILEKVTGRRFSEMLSTDLWSRIGAEYDALVTVDPAGFPMANGGICVTLRDLARFGRVVLDSGLGRGGEQVIPADWITDTRRGGDPEAARESMQDAHPEGSYRNQFWVSGDDHGCFYGVGIYGQYVWLNPATDTVIAKLSSLPDADDTANWVEHVRLLDTLAVGGE